MKIRDTRISCKVRGLEELPERLDGVLHVSYLVFNEGCVRDWTIAPPVAI